MRLSDSPLFDEIYRTAHSVWAAASDFTHGVGLAGDASVPAGSAAGVTVGRLMASSSEMALTLLAGPFTITSEGDLALSGATGPEGSTLTARVKAERATPYLSITQDLSVDVVAGVVIAAPSNDTPAVIAGGRSEGSILTATPGVWTGADEVTGQWQMDGVDVLGATNLTYRTTFADLTKAPTYVETAVNGGGSTAQTSNALPTVINGVVARFAMRATAGLLTDDPRWTYLLGTDSTPTTRVPSGTPAGQGYTGNHPGGASFSDTDSGSTYPKQLRGQASITGGSGRVLVQVPAGVPVKVRIAHGTLVGTAASGFIIQDNDDGPTLYTGAITAPPVGSVAGIDGTVSLAADWMSESPSIELTSASGVLCFRKHSSATFFVLRCVEVTYPSFDVVTSGVGPFYVDNAAGNDTTGDGSLAKPWKSIPGDPGAGGVVSAFDVLPGGSILLKRGQRHRPATFTGRYDKHLQFLRDGETGNPITVGAYGVGDAPILDGSEALDSGWSAATTGDLLGNTTSGVQKRAISGVLDFCQVITDGEGQLYPAQWPTPSAPAHYNRTYSGNDAHIGIAEASYSAKVSTGASDSAGSGYRACTITSDAGAFNLKDRYGPDSVSLVGWIVEVLITGTRMVECVVETHNPSTGVIGFKLPNLMTLQAATSATNFQFCIRYHPYDLRSQGQYAWNAAKTEAFGKFATSSRGIVRLEYGVRFSKDYWVVDGVDFQRFGVMQGGAVADASVRTGCQIKNSKWAQISNPEGNAAFRPASLSGIDLTNVAISDSPRIGFAQAAVAPGSVMDTIVAREGGRTSGYIGTDGVTLRNFDASDQDSIHGNGASMYQRAANCVLEQFYIMNHPLPLTMQRDDAAAGLIRNNTIKNGVLTTKRAYPGAPFGTSLYALTLAEEEIGSQFEGLVVGIHPAILSRSTTGFPPSTGAKFKNCVFSSIAAAELTDMIFENCLIIGEEGLLSFAGKGVDPTSFGNQFGSHPAYDGTITETMQKFLTKNGAAATYSARTLGPNFNPWVVPAWGAAFALADCNVTTTKVRGGHRALLAFASVVATQPGSAISLPAGLGNNSLFGMAKGQVWFLADAAPGVYSLVVRQTNSHPNLTGGGTQTKDTTITITVA